MIDRNDLSERSPRKAVDDTEMVPDDDAVIGRAFRWSLAVLVVFGVVAGVVLVIANRPQELAPPVPAGPIKIVVPVRAADPPSVVFTDITSDAGIGFVHTNGAVGDKLLPETMGGGCAFLDYDGDGDQDLLFVNSSHWPDHPSGDGPPATMALYRNDGTGRFEDVTAEAGLDVGFYGMGVAAGDYDNDGDVDLFLTAVGPDHLYRNDDGVFTDVTRRAGTGGDPDGWSTSSGFFDYDNDGDLDLFVCNYVRWSREIDFAVDFRLTGIGRAYGPPSTFEGTFASLYRNNGDGTFTDVSAESGIEVVNAATGVAVGKALAVVFIDIDRDGWMDIFVANDTVANFLFRNTGASGEPGFQEIGAAAGVAYSSMGAATGAMGIDAAYYREPDDGSLGFCIGNFANEMSSLYVSQGRPWQFADEAIGEGVGAPSRRVLSFGLFFFDYDLDGRLDLLQANGHLEEAINTVQSSQHYRQAAQLFWNTGPGSRVSFVHVPTAATGDLARPIVGRGAAYADIDGDGDLDVVLTQTGGPPMLLRNDQALGHRGLRVKLVGNGTTSNRDAIGAWVHCTLTGGRVMARQVMPTRSYLSQVERVVTFGLGPGDVVEALSVTWPDGTVGSYPAEPDGGTDVMVITQP